MRRRRRTRLVATLGMLAVPVWALAVPDAHAASTAPGAGPPLYVAEYTRGTVVKVASDGTQSSIIDGLNTPYAIAVDAAGNRYIADLYGDKVVKVLPDGSKTTIAHGPADGGPSDLTGIDDAFGVAVDSTGNVFIADYKHQRLAKLTPDGTLTTLADGWDGPTGVAVDSAGNVYGSKYWLGQVVKVKPDGTQKIIADFGPNTHPDGIAVDAAGNVYIAVSLSNKVVKVSPGGKQTQIGGTMLFPWGVAVDSAGNVYVAQQSGGDVVKVPPRCTSNDCHIPVGSGLANTAGVALAPLPSAPTKVRVPAPWKGLTQGRAAVSFKPSTSPSVVSYTVTARNLTHPNKGGQIAQGTRSPITVAGLSPGDRYTFTVTATNRAEGTSTPSAASKPVWISAHTSPWWRILW